MREVPPERAGGAAGGPLGTALRSPAPPGDGEVPQTAPPHVPPPRRLAPLPAESRFNSRKVGREPGAPRPDVQFLPRGSWGCPWGRVWGGCAPDTPPPRHLLLPGHPVDPGGLLRQQHHLQLDRERELPPGAGVPPSSRQGRAEPGAAPARGDAARPGAGQERHPGHAGRGVPAARRRQRGHLPRQAGPALRHPQALREQGDAERPAHHGRQPAPAVLPHPPLRRQGPPWRRRRRAPAGTPGSSCQLRPGGAGRAGKGDGDTEPLAARSSPLGADPAPAPR